MLAPHQDFGVGNEALHSAEKIFAAGAAGIFWWIQWQPRGRGIGATERCHRSTSQPMWPRKQIDVGAADIAYGMGQVLWGGAEESAALSPDPGWIPDDEALVCLSVRSGFDLLLTALGLPPGSEIVVSAVTIPDMVRIIEHHGCVAVPVDVDLEG